LPFWIIRLQNGAALLRQNLHILAMKLLHHPVKQDTAFAAIFNINRIQCRLGEDSPAPCQPLCAVSIGNVLWNLLTDLSAKDNFAMPLYDAFKRTRLDAQ
jgi:hypothetical protein